MGADQPGERAALGPRSLTVTTTVADLNDGTLFPAGADPSAPAGPVPAHDRTSGPPGDRVVGVVADVPALDRVLDYVVPARWADQVDVGTVVRIPLQGRRVRGWVVEVDRTPPPGLALRAVTRISGIGPPADLIDLGRWAAHRWSGKLVTFLRAATPERAVHHVVPVAGTGAHREGADSSPGDDGGALLHAAAHDAEGSAAPVRVLRWPPGTDRLGLARAALARGPALLLTPSQHEADMLVRRLRAEGHAVARHPDGWAAGAGGATMVGGRAALWAPVTGLRTIVVFDEHDERYQDERAPTWHARAVAAERAARCGAVAVLVSPVPSPEALALGPLVRPSRAVERAGWPMLGIVDRRSLDPRDGLYPHEVVEALRDGGRVVVVHNRTGRARLLACTRCGELCRCDECGAAVHSSGRGTAASPRTLRCSAGHVRPEICGACGATRLAVLRPGVDRVRDDVEALVGEPVAEITAELTDTPGPNAGVTAGPGETGVIGDEPRVWVGTEAVLHRVRRADTVVFLDLDQHLLAPRFTAGARTLSLLALAARILGGRHRDGRLVVQTRQPNHDVVEAVLHADPERWSDAETDRRQALGLPPFSALALLEGPGAAAFAASVRDLGELSVQGPSNGRYLVRAATSEALADGLARVERPSERVRIAVDPADV